MDDMCTACLCTGRKLYFIGETGHYHLYSQILNEIPVYDFSDVCVRVCWECRALLRRFGEFKALVKRSYNELLLQVHQNIPSDKQSLARPPHLQIQQVVNLCYPEHKVKEEPSKDRDEDGLEGLPPVEDIPDDFEEMPPSIEDVDVPDEFKVEVECETFGEAWDSEQVSTKKRKKTSLKEIANPKILASPSENSTSVALSHRQSAVILSVKEKANVSLQALKEKAKTTKVKVKVKKKKLPQKRKRELDAEESELPTNGNSDCDMDRISDKELSTDSGNNCDKGGNEDCSKKRPKANGKIPERQPELIGDKTKCGECGKMFSSKKTYRYHLNTLHKGQNRYPCPRCGKVYQWKSNLGRHMRSHKAVDAGELYCAPCGRAFASVATYRQHLRVSRRHVAEHDFSFECSECGKRFVNKTRLRDHVDWEHLQKVKFRCQLCDKPFKCHTSLYVHMQNVHRNKKKENLCHICGKSYQNAAKLKYHIVAMHTSETPYSCAQCGAAFGWYSSLYRHTREVHHQMKLQPKKSRKQKREMPPLMFAAGAMPPA